MVTDSLLSNKFCHIFSICDELGTVRLTATDCIYLMYSVTESEDVNGTANFWVPWPMNLEQFAINSVRQQFVAESIQRPAKDISLRSWTITNTIRQCGALCDHGTVYKCSDLLTVRVAGFICSNPVNTHTEDKT